MHLTFLAVNSKTWLRTPHELLCVNKSKQRLAMVIGILCHVPRLLSKVLIHDMNE